MTVNDAYIIFMHLKSNMDRFIEETGIWQMLKK